MGVSWASAGPARSCSTARPCSPACCSALPVPDIASRPSKAWRRAAGCTRSRTRSPSWARRNAATAPPRSCSRPRHCSPSSPAPRALRSSRRSPATSAAAPATSRSTRPWSWPRRACGARTPRRLARPCMATRKKRRTVGLSDSLTVKRSQSDSPTVRLSDHRVIGRALRKIGATAKVNGATIFADDLFFPRMLYAKLLRSPHPHAKILRVDVAKAARLAGVRAVLTGKDLPIPFGILPVSQDEHALAPDKVRFVGDPVAAVAATSEDVATAALDLITVEYAPLRPVPDAEDAVAHPEPRIHDYGDGGNLHKLIHLEFGDVETGFAAADLVREDLFFYEGSTHLPMEQHAAVAQWSADRKLTVWSSTQTPHYVHRALAKVLELPPARIRVIATPNGGGFGGKSDPFSHEIVVAKLAMVTGRPVKITLTREEVFYCHRGRHPTLMWIKTGVTKDGAITAMHFKSLLDGGGYGSYGVASTYYTGALQTVTYPVARYKFQGARAFTNKPPCGPKRGHGTPQPRYALEVHLDKLAEQLQVDPAELRLKHLVPPNSLTANYLRVGSMGLGACIEKVVAGSDWKRKFRQLPEGKGVGIACSSYICGAGLPIYWNNMPHSGVQLKCDRGGGVTVFCGSTEIGQGSDSILAYIVAEVLGLDPFDIAVVTADTDLTPVDLGSYSSRVTLMTGNAAIEAAVMGQVEGSVYMGLGEALMEEMAYRGNRNVVHKIPSLLEYKSPTTLEMCDVVTYLIEDPDPSGPFGAKEVGQGPLLPVPPAIANAVYDAVGVRVDEVPITPEKVLKALKKKTKGEEGRVGPTRFPDIPWPEPIRVPPPWEGGDGGAVPVAAAALERQH